MESFNSIAGIPYSAGMDWLDFNRLMLSQYGASLIHSSVVEHRGEAILFLGESGTGKSTQSRLWLQNIPHTTLLNDDCPALRIHDGTLHCYGTPWSGKTPCYRHDHFPVRALVRLSQAPANQLRRLPTVAAFAALQPSFAPELATDPQYASLIIQLISRILPLAPVYHLACLPHPTAVHLLHQELYGHTQ